MEERLDINWDDILSEDEKLLIINTANQLGADKLKPIKEALPEEISYFKIKAALAKARIQG